MRVRDYMTRTVISVKPDTEILRALHLMHAHDISNAPVVDDRGALTGILSDRDCIRGVLQATYHSELAGLVGDFMASDVKTVGPDEGLISATRSLLHLPHRLYPVVAGGDLVGVISRRDIIAALTDRWQWSS
ncbi:MULTISPECIES: CBS domain-containing protein [Ruegeria]|uniref:CBS domain-containing protein n=1 Tax=Ruegeria TaxID=97050 RepID=UPI00147E899D|nr:MULTISPECIES: CBS domain-containing protein [Ruegeria]MBY6082762.1 CBS domain-containing protein [Ruegeria arenilitoris]UWR08371.1 CBS domain-containing protein [Ruegeria sp. B32]